MSTLKYTHRYSIAEYNVKNVVNGAKALLKDGQTCKCHKVAVNYLPSALSNELVPVTEICTTHCSRALLAIDEATQELAYIQTCEVQAQKFPLEKVEAKSKIETLLF